MSYKFGNIDVYKIYKGSTLVYDVTPEPELKQTLDRIALNGWTNFNPTIQNGLNFFIKEMKSSGLWTKTKVTRFKRFNDTTLLNAIRINLKNPNGDLATLHGGLAFTNNGIKYNGVNSWFNEKFNPVTAGLTIDNFAVSHHFQDDFPITGNALCGIAGTVPTRRMAVFPKSGGNPSQGTIDAITQANDYTNSSQRVASGSRLHIYGRNATKKTSQINSTYEEFSVTALTPLLNFDYFTGALNERNTAKFFCDGTDSFFWAGEWLSEAEVNNLRTIVNNFYTRTGQTLIL